MDNILLENNIDLTSCTQRMLCSSVKKAANNVVTGRGNSMDKIIDGVATNEWLLSFIEETSIHLAVKDGLGDVNCLETYNNCKISQRTVNTFLRKCGKLVKSFISY
ncbi:hypothetical protein JTB14_001046 [Gonioctena quinquepunctata]|nr:hypothetical protein JTB14_001046 [Gonioctena quinquepunctata]